ncbi:LeuA family protein [Natrononativus amylolyticus]|uniref:LeuA family protein n=1 Tax=Natrononativus amylolyticus TaxID=2963434 RepID=UPI0020CE4866|nr:LeuA family protein [Natrononativus amylolyticus]
MQLLDATVREGAQRSSVTYSVEQKVAVAEALDDLGVSFIQLGFPIVGDETAEAAARLDTEAQLTGIARAVEGDIDAAAAADLDVIEVSAPTSRLQRERLLGATKAELKETVVDALEYAAETGLEVHFGAMDGFRTEPAFLADLARLVTPYTDWVTVADTVGSCLPERVTETLDALEAVDGEFEIGVHFHDDLGLATANALLAARRGVGKVDVTVGGVGERAGNTPLEELVIAAELAGDVPLDVEPARVIPAATQILDELDEPVSSGKPVIGAGVFEHESGMHTAAMLDEPATFEPFEPARFGGDRRLLFGSASGRGAARRLLERAGVDPTPERIEAVLTELHATETALELEEAVRLAERVVETDS